MLARASTKTFASRVRKTAKKNLCSPKNSLAGSLISQGITVLEVLEVIWWWWWWCQQQQW